MTGESVRPLGPRSALLAEQRDRELEAAAERLAAQRLHVAAHMARERPVPVRP